jgi:uracil-DNA glycosylase
MLAAMGVRVFETAQEHTSAQSVRAEPVEAPDRPELVEGQAQGDPSIPQGERISRPAPALRQAHGERSTALQDIATLDWPALRAVVSECRACALCESRTQTVFGVGHERARLMIVGEAPGENEDLQGEPFVGQSGKLLDNMLKAIGLARTAATPEQAVFICNTVKCRPPRNRNPDAAEIARCAPFLERQIELVQPKLLLAMGRFAVQALLGSDEAIGKLRGRVHDRRGVPVIVTYHPAYLLRTLADKARAWDDLCLAASVLELPA